MKINDIINKLKTANKNWKEFDFYAEDIDSWLTEIGVFGYVTDNYYNLIKKAYQLKIGDLKYVGLPSPKDFPSDVVISCAYKNVLFILYDDFFNSPKDLKDMRIFIFDKENFEWKRDYENSLEVFGRINNGKICGWLRNGSWKNFILNYFEMLILLVADEERKIKLAQLEEYKKCNKKEQEKIFKLNKIFKTQ
jgi:hypothetical protein